MFSEINEVIWNYVPILLVILIFLIIVLILLQIKNYFKKNKTIETKTEKKSTVTEENKNFHSFFPSVSKKEEVAPKFVDATTMRIYTHILNEIRNLTTDGQELGFDYKSDYIQLLIADVPKVIDYYKKNFGEFKEDVIPVLPCIPENLIPPNQLIANTFMRGKCNLPLERIKNTSNIPKKPYWLFEIKINRISPEEIFLTEGIGLTINEIVRTAVIKDKLWRNTSNHLVGTGSLLDEISPIIFRYNHSGDYPEIITYSEKELARDYYLATCKDRVCFAE